MKTALLLFVAFTLPACGYHLKGSDTRIPGGIRSVHVGEFTNQSRQFGLDRQLAMAFEREFLRRGLLRVVEEPGTGDAELIGTIRSFRSRPVAFDSRDEALEYEATLVLDVSLRRREDGKVLWHVSNLREVEPYSVVARIVVPSSAGFQRDTIAVGDLRGLTDIQLAETTRRGAVSRLVGSVVRDVHDRIFDDF